jgi:excisionase family DNA binding protein
MHSDIPQPPSDWAATMLGLLQHLVAVVEDLRGKVDGARKELFTVEEVARLTGRAAYTVRRWVSEGRLRATRVEGTGRYGRLLIPGDELLRLLPQGLGGDLPVVALAQRGGKRGDRP